MENLENKQHVEVPHLDKKDKEITPSEQLVYACIRRYMNKDTKESGVSMKRIGEICGASRPTISKCIEKLEKCDYFTITKKPGGKDHKMMNYYKINTKKGNHFEEFTIDFLEKEDLPFLQKAYLLAAQQYMFKDREPGTGIIEMSNQELGNNINVSARTIQRYNKSLEEKDYLTIIKNTKKFDLEALGQAIACMACVAQNHEERLTELEQDRIKIKQEIIEELKQEYDFSPKKKEIIMD